MAFYIWIAFLLGSSVGSFLNVLIDRLPLGQDVIKGRSHCDHCHRTLSWYELIPVVSWIFQAGKSRCCHKTLSFQYPLIELIVGIGFALVYQFMLGDGQAVSVSSVAVLVLFCSMVGIFVTDLKTECIPEVFLYAGGIATIGLLSPILASCVSGSASSCSLLVSTYIIPASIGAGFFFFLWLFSKGKAMGDGDIYLAGIMGLALGYPKLVIAYYVAFLTGAIAGVILILVHKKRMQSHIPFGPFLIAGFGVASLYSGPILHWWSQLW